MMWNSLKGYGETYSNGQTHKERKQQDRNIREDKKNQNNPPIR